MTKKTLHLYLCIISVLTGVLSLVVNLELKNVESPVSFSISTAQAKSNFEVAGWIPYWSMNAGIRDVRAHLSDFTRIYPFSFTVDKNGKVKEQAKLKENASWKRLVKAADSKDVQVIPTIMWSDGANIHKVLSNPTSRAEHIQNIIEVVNDGKFDGVDIDYEAKLVSTKDSFSAFLIELKTKLEDKMLICTIEARTPADSLYVNPPAVIKHANDYEVIGRYCDRVQIMTYDQGRADLKLNNEKNGRPYSPVSDADWVRKVIELTIKTIPKEKLVLGLATYGREYEVTVSPNRFANYKQIRAINGEAAERLALNKKVTPSRNQAGEVSFSYLPKSSKLTFPKSLSIPENTTPGNTIAAKALAYANSTGKTVKFNLVWWSDAEAMRQKVELAKEYGLAGVAIFKIDGEQDDDLWEIFDEA